MPCPNHIKFRAKVIKTTHSAHDSTVRTRIVQILNDAYSKFMYIVTFDSSL